MNKLLQSTITRIYLRKKRKMWIAHIYGAEWINMNIGHGSQSTAKINSISFSCALPQFERVENVMKEKERHKVTAFWSNRCSNGIRILKADFCSCIHFQATEMAIGEHAVSHRINWVTTILWFYETYTKCSVSTEEIFSIFVLTKNRTTTKIFIKSLFSVPVRLQRQVCAVKTFCRQHILETDIWDKYNTLRVTIINNMSFYPSVFQIKEKS